MPIATFLPAIGGGAVAGAIAGSFVATLVLRWPRGVSVVAGRSCCDHCAVRLPAWALVPLVSYVALRGRCHRCGGRIDRHHFAVELAAAAIGAAAFAAHPTIAGAAGAVFGWALLTLAILDAEHFWLPDRLTLPLALLGLLAGLRGLPPAIGGRAIGMIGGFLLLQAVRLIYRRLRGREGMGGGDPKLFGAIGAWLGWADLPLVLTGAASLGLLWTLVVATRTRALAGDARLPFGVMLAVSAWLIWLVRS